MTNLEKLVGLTQDHKDRAAAIQKLTDTADLIRYAERIIRDREKDLASTSHAAFHFPSIRAKAIKEKEKAERVLPRLKTYFNNQLETLKYK